MTDLLLKSLVTAVEAERSFQTEATTSLVTLALERAKEHLEQIEALKDPDIYVLNQS